VDRVKWFRDRAARDRAREEMEILKAEFDRTKRSFTRMSDVWTMLAKDANFNSSAAYAHKQASLYCALAEDCRTMYEKAITLQATVDKSSSDVSSPIVIVTIVPYSSHSRRLVSVYTRRLYLVSFVDNFRLWLTDLLDNTETFTIVDKLVMCVHT